MCTHISSYMFCIVHPALLASFLNGEVNQHTETERTTCKHLRRWGSLIFVHSSQELPTPRRTWERRERHWRRHSQLWHGWWGRCIHAIMDWHHHRTKPCELLKLDDWILHGKKKWEKETNQEGWMQVEVLVAKFMTSQHHQKSHLMLSSMHLWNSFPLKGKKLNYLWCKVYLK